MAARIYMAWLQFLRFANAVDLHGAQRSGNLEAVAWTRIRIADLDRQIDQLSIARMG